MITVPPGNWRGLKIWYCVKRKKLRCSAEAFFFCELLFFEKCLDKENKKHYDDFAAGKPTWIENIVGQHLKKTSAFG